MKAWAEQKGDFAHSFFLAHFYFATGHKPQGLATLRGAARKPMRLIANREGWVDWLAFQAAETLYKSKDNKATLALCDRWEEFCKREKRGDRSFYGFRAACLLRMGEFDKARPQVQAALDVPVNDWIRHLAELKQAIETRNRDYAYDPGSVRPFRVEPDYE